MSRCAENHDINTYNLTRYTYLIVQVNPFLNCTHILITRISTFVYVHPNTHFLIWKPANRIYFNPVRFPAVGVLQRWIRAQWEPSQDGDDKAGVDFRWWRFLTCGSMGNLYLENNCFRTVCVCLIHLFYLVNDCIRIIYLYLIHLLYLENNCFRIIYLYLIHLSNCPVLWTICLFVSSYICMQCAY